MHVYYAQYYAHIKQKTGEGCMALIKIQENSFNIVQRLKEIDENYFVVFNTKTSKFEIHNSAQNLSTFCLTVDGELDCRVIKKVLKTRAENIEKLLREIEEHNEKLEKEKNRKVHDELSFKLGETFDYYKSGKEDLTGAYSTRFV